MIKKRTKIILGVGALVAMIAGNAANTATAAPEPPSPGVVVFGTTGSLMTSVGMITGNLTVKVDGTTVTAQYRNAAEWYPVARCRTEDSTACVWVGPTQGNGHGAIVVNSDPEGK